MVDDVRKAVTLIQQPETRADVWRIIEFVSEQFDKRVGLTDLAYGLNPGGTQSRTAEETSAKVRAMGVRPEHMQRKVVEWQSEIATVEAFLTRWFVDGDSVYPRLGPIGKYLWERYIMMGDVERVVRQMQYSVSASSIRRPNRDRDIANYQQVMQYFVPTAQEYAQQTGNYSAYNWLKNKWAEYHDLDLSGADLEMLQPDAQAQQLQQQQAAMEMAKIQADLQAKQLDMQAKQMELQGKQAQIGMTLEGKRAELELQAQGAQQQMAQDQAKHLMEMLQDRQKFKLDVAQQKELGVVKVQLARKAASARPQGNGAKTATHSKA